MIPDNTSLTAYFDISSTEKRTTAVKGEIIHRHVFVIGFVTTSSSLFLLI